MTETLPVASPALSVAHLTFIDGTHREMRLELSTFPQQEGRAALGQYHQERQTYAFRTYRERMPASIKNLGQIPATTHFDFTTGAVTYMHSTPDGVASETGLPAYEFKSTFENMYGAQQETQRKCMVNDKEGQLSYIDARFDNDGKVYLLSFLEFPATIHPIEEFFIHDIRYDPSSGKMISIDYNQNNKRFSVYLDQDNPQQIEKLMNWSPPEGHEIKTHFNADEKNNLDQIVATAKETGAMALGLVGAPLVPPTVTPQMRARLFDIMREYGAKRSVFYSSGGGYVGDTKTSLTAADEVFQHLPQDEGRNLLETPLQYSPRKHGMQNTHYGLIVESDRLARSVPGLSALGAIERAISAVLPSELRAEIAAPVLAV